MLKLIILAVVGYIFYRALKSWMLGSGSHPLMRPTRTNRSR
jgi:hypothetical protein